MVRLDIHHYHHGDQGEQPPEGSWLRTTLEKIMSQLDDLNTLGTGIKADLDVIKAGVASQADRIQSLVDQLTQLQQTTPPQVDLSSAIANAQAIKDEADAIAASLGASAPASPDGSTPPAGDTSTPPPPPPPPSDGSAGTSDTSTGSTDTGSSTPSDTSTADPSSTPPADSTPPSDGSTTPDTQP